MTKLAPKDFYHLIYEVVLQIPEGRVTSYGAIANFLGAKGSSRTVGYALTVSKKGEIPAHRLVNRNGLLSGKHHFGGPDVMQQLLELEGVKVEKDHVVDFKNRFWDPAQFLQPLG